MANSDHVCTMFCDCPAAQQYAGGTAARDIPYRPRQGAPSSPREAAVRVEVEQRGAWRVRDPR